MGRATSQLPWLSGTTIALILPIVAFACKYWSNFTTDPYRDANERFEHSHLASSPASWTASHTAMAVVTPGARNSIALAARLKGISVDSTTPICFIRRVSRLLLDLPMA